MFELIKNEPKVKEYHEKYIFGFFKSVFMEHYLMR